jgi:LPS sulfotransferase NodH/2-polyprenyl-3-methyl-5-hydroxy-6-metoxy-1,4-benzoquinol methylase
MVIEMANVQGQVNKINIQKKGSNLAKPILYLTDVRLDFRRSVPLRKSYIVASSYRCGSTFLCKELWQTGLLGAPWEYFNPRKSPNTNSIQNTLMKRLKASSLEDYVAKLIACRTSRNGVFGMKVHFEDFEAALQKYPTMLEKLAPVTYIFMDRRDKLAQAVSMARAMQTNSWISLAKPQLTKLHYDRDLISKCLGKHEIQRLGWQRWFEGRDINPFVVLYEELIADPAGVVRSIVEYLDVQDDNRNIIRLPTIEKQGDDVNEEWIARFTREVQSGIVTSGNASDGQQPALIKPTGQTSAEGKAGSMDEKAEGHFFERYAEFAHGEHPRPLRLRRRYDAIIGRNRELFENARVLDIGSGDGLWCMAALDAGATSVIGIEPNKKRADVAKSKFAQLGIKATSCQFVNLQMFQALQRFRPDEFDLVLCTGFLEQTDPRYFFDHMRRLRPKHVVVDTGIAPGMNPVMRFSLKQRDEAASQSTPLSASILSTPTHELIAFLCDVYGFRWEAIDFQAMGITDWTGIRDYERERRRTYVLELAT